MRSKSSTKAESNEIVSIKTQEHVHKWKEDSFIGHDEQRCACGYWRCKYRTKAKERCEEAAVRIDNYCSKHKTSSRQFPSTIST